MKHAPLLLLIFLVIACKKDDPQEPCETLSSEAALLKLEVEHDGISYPTTINGTTVSNITLLPNSAQEVTITTIETSPGASAQYSAGQVLAFLSGEPQPIQITAQDQSTATYELILEVEEPDYNALLFDDPTNSSCQHYATLSLNGMVVENNVWNAGNLTPGSFSQCVYVHETSAFDVFGWEWDYPANANGVNAYPQVIYGWKPWQPQSTNQVLPKMVSDITRMKVTYDAEVTRNEGDYNLAFDNWIGSSPNVTPQNVLFEFMIWEDVNNLVPFGDYQEDVTTSNGTYRFFTGQPTWEPPGSDWTYLAFERIGNRTAGTVDIDELLDYLVDKGIVNGNHYFASIEFGNEVGNSTGKTIIKQFDVDIE